MAPRKLKEIHVNSAATPPTGKSRIPAPTHSGTSIKRRTRSRAGCAQCVGVSRKCDERRPVCSRCERLKFNCDTRTRFIWKSSAVAPVVSPVSPVPRERTATSCGCSRRPTSEQLIQMCKSSLCCLCQSIERLTSCPADSLDSRTQLLPMDFCSSEGSV
jgi:hypothetical protein